MAKKLIAALLLVCVLCSVLTACKKEKITGEQALQVVLKDMKLNENQVSNVHIHEGTYEDKPCFNIYVDANGVSLLYVVSDVGKILTKGPSAGHSHGH